MNSLPDFYDLTPRALHGQPSSRRYPTRYRPHSAAAVFLDLLEHAPTPLTGHLTGLPANLLLDLTTAQLPVLGAHLAADYLQRLTAFRKIHPSYTIFRDPEFVGSHTVAAEVNGMLGISLYMDAEYIAMDALKGFCNPGTPAVLETHQHMYGFFVDKLQNYLPYFVVRPVLIFAKLQTLLTDADDRTLEFVLRALTPYYMVRDTDLSASQPDRWVGTYLEHSAPKAWRDMLATPLRLF